MDLSNFHINFTQALSQQHPGAAIGILIAENVDNHGAGSSLSLAAARLANQKNSLENELRSRYIILSRQELNELPVLSAYKEYYRQFKKTYHVLLQLESILHEERSFPSVSPLVDIAFLSEMDTLLLTAAHDLDKLTPPISFDVAAKSEPFTQMNGSETRLKKGDIVMRDANGPVCSIIYGQDNISPVTPATRNVLYVTYTAPGISIETLEEHLEKQKSMLRQYAASGNTNFHSATFSTEIYTQRPTNLSAD